MYEILGDTLQPVPSVTEENPARQFLSLKEEESHLQKHTDLSVHVAVHTELGCELCPGPHLLLFPGKWDSTSWVDQEASAGKCL